MKINAEWHSRHRMPKNPTLDQRLEWHLAHARHCSCRRLSGKIQEEMKARYLGTHQEFWVYFTRNDHLALAAWAADCAEHVLALFEEKYPGDLRPKNAILTLRNWINTGEFSMRAIKGASLSAHAAARAVEKDQAASFVARATGQAVAAAHVPTHALGAALYALKAIAAANPHKTKAATDAERSWQIERLPENLRQWVVTGLKEKQTILPRNLRG
jgi:hypothetical protein